MDIFSSKKLKRFCLHVHSLQWGFLVADHSGVIVVQGVFVFT